MENSANTKLKDVVQHCGRTYKENFIDTEIRYRIDFFAESSFDIIKDTQKPEDIISISQNTINEIEIAFTSLELKHLAGIGKFPDIHKQDRPQAIYEKMLGMHKSGDILTLQDISESDFFFDDIDRTQNEETVGMTDEEFQKKIEAERLSNRKILKSDFLGRLSALENLSRIIAQSELAENSNDTKSLELKIYAWDREASRSERPHNSDIKANFLVEIYDKNNSPKPYTDFFIVRGENGTYRGMSVFSSEVSYSCDNIGRKVPKVTVLSLETLKKGKGISVISADDRIIADCRKRETEHNERLMKEKNDNPNKELKKAFIKELAKSRKDVIKCERTSGKADCKRHYCNLVELTEKRLNKNPVDLFCTFSVEDIESIIKDLNLNSDRSKEKYISYETDTLRTVIALKNMLNGLEQLLKQEDFSVDDYWHKLSTISEYLKNQNVGSNLVLKVADLIEQQKENCNEFTAELIDDAVTEMKQNAEKKPEDRINFNHSSTVKSGNIKMMQFHNRDADSSGQINIIPNGAVAIPIYNPFRDALRSLADNFKKILYHIQNALEKAKELIQQAFSKPQNDDTTQSEFAPETQNFFESTPERYNDDKQNRNTAIKSNDSMISDKDNVMKNVVNNANVQDYRENFTELQGVKQDTELKNANQFRSYHSISAPETNPEPESTIKSEVTPKTEISSISTETEIQEDLNSALELLITTGYFDIPRIFEEIKQDILLENPGIAINDADLEFLLISYDIPFFQEEPDQNQSNKKQAEYNY